MTDNNLSAETTEDVIDYGEVDNSDVDIVEADGTKEDTSTDTALADDGTTEDTDTADKAQGEETDKPIEEPKKEVDKAEQTKAQNAEFAKQRREAEKKAEIETAVKQARVDAIIDAVKENPYTKEKLSDEADVEQYLLMKQIELDGKDPIQDYPKYAKKAIVDAAAKQRAEADKKTAQQKDIEDFKARFPDVDLQEVAKDTDFDEFCKGRFGNIALADLYSQFTSLKERLSGQALKAKKTAEVSQIAKSKAAVGSLASTDVGDGNYYTADQLNKMSKSEIARNWDKVEKSYERILNK